MKHNSAITGVNVIFEGVGNIGSCEFKQADVSFLELDQETGVGKRSVTTPLFESLDVEYKFKSIPANIYKEMAKLDQAKVIAKRTMKTGSNDDVEEWQCRGGMSIKYGNSKAGEFLDVTVTQKGLSAYFHELNDEVITDIDHDKGIGEHGGIDHAKHMRQSLQ
ncbi:phage tail protein [Malaciobacter canalis]|uniref:Phage tail protein n=1 Tax=Malaciobacter canalis TaxID=1912871 RepID=A0ABX4LUA7_9BACT|nr:phage major tail tube protein [Malaciobacter canalis]PHO09786.1 phage tail protein [Malaciobacter canalis]QEE33404.1 phage tail tube protein [Malaciobacter canalis]